MSDLERVTVNLTRRAATAMRLAAELTGDSKTDTINRALQVYAFLEGMTAEGGILYVRRGSDGQLEQLQFL